jgi:alpha-tubulin suppressor-like RCC1 family protein
MKKDGRLWAWGLNDDGELGNGTYLNSNVPGLVSKRPVSL